MTSLVDIRELEGLMQERGPEAAITALERLTRQVPTYATAHVLLARAYEAAGRWDEAQQAWQRAYFLVPNSPAVDHGLRRVHHRQLPALGRPAQGDGSGAPDEKPLGFEDLDSLIQELETARIEPSPDPDAIPAPDLEDDIDEMVSETLARIYASQHQYREAARVYLQLAQQEPARAREFRQKAEEMRDRAREEGN